MAKIYLISPENISNLDEFALQLEEMCCLEERPAFFQLRIKGSSLAEIETEIKMAIEKLLPICKKYGVQFVINDHINLALKFGIGVHVGSEDASLESCIEFKKLGGVHLGVSCYNSIVRAKEFENVADCISFGAMFVSSTKPHAKACELETIKYYAKHNPEKEIAIIGGIDENNIENLAEILPIISYVCVISSVWN